MEGIEPVLLQAIWNMKEDIWEDIASLTGTVEVEAETENRTFTVSTPGCPTRGAAGGEREFSGRIAS